MQKHYETPWHRDLTPAEEEKLLRMEEQMREADKKSPLLMKSHLETFNDGVIAIIIGIFIRKPFIGVDRFVSEKLEETEVL